MIVQLGSIRISDKRLLREAGGPRGALFMPASDLLSIVARLVRSKVSCTDVKPMVSTPISTTKYPRGVICSAIICIANEARAGSVPIIRKYQLKTIIAAPPTIINNPTDFISHLPAAMSFLTGVHAREHQTVNSGLHHSFLRDLQPSGRGVSVTLRIMTGTGVGSRALERGHYDVSLSTEYQRATA